MSIQYRNANSSCTGTTDLSTHQIMSFHFPFPSVFRFPDSSDLSIDYVYRVEVIDKNNATLTESSLFYLKPGMPPASTPTLLDSGGPKNQGLSPGTSAGLAVGLSFVIMLLSLGGWKLWRCLTNRSVVKRRASIRASIRHLVPLQQAVVMNGTELHKITDRPLSMQTAASTTCVRSIPPRHDFASPPRPPRSSSSIYSLDYSSDSKVVLVRIAK